MGVYTHQKETSYPGFYKWDLQNATNTVWSPPCRALGDWKVAETRVSHPPGKTHNTEIGPIGRSGHSLAPCYSTRHTASSSPEHGARARPLGRAGQPSNSQGLDWRPCELAQPPVTPFLGKSVRPSLPVNGCKFPPGEHGLGRGHTRSRTGWGERTGPGGEELSGCKPTWQGFLSWALGRACGCFVSGPLPTPSLRDQKPKENVCRFLTQPRACENGPCVPLTCARVLRPSVFCRNGSRSRATPSCGTWAATCAWTAAQPRRAA